MHCTSIEKIILMASGLVLFQPSFDQKKNFVPGYVIRAGDTVRGFVNYRNGEANPEKIRFKEKVDGEITDYAPIDLIEFGAIPLELRREIGMEYPIISCFRHPPPESSSSWDINSDNDQIQALFQIL